MPRIRLPWVLPQPGKCGEEVLRCSGVEAWTGQPTGPGKGSPGHAEMVWLTFTFSVKFFTNCATSPSDPLVSRYLE